MSPVELASLAAALLLFAGISRRAEHSPLTPPIFFVAVGLLAGPAGLGWIALDGAEHGVHLLAELTLVLVLFTDAARIDLACLRREESLPARLLGVGMPLTIAAGALAAATVLPGFGPWECLLLAAILAPTDAALGQAVVSNPRVPVRIRQSLNVESGLNDGIALPLVLVLAMLGGAREEAAPVGEWLRFAALQVTLGPATGALVGWVGGRGIERGATAGWISSSFQRLSGLGLAVLAFAGAELVGGNGFIAAFVAGLTLGNTARTVCSRIYDFGEAEGQLLTLLVFVVFGALMVPEAVAALRDGPGGVAPALAYAALSLSVVRMLPVALALLGAGLRPASVAFLGWFGPRGLASILFALLIVEERGGAAAEQIQAIVVLTVLASTLAHGVTAFPLASRYASWVTAIRQHAEAEHAESMELPVRLTHTFGRAHPGAPPEPAPGTPPQGGSR